MRTPSLLRASRGRCGLKRPVTHRNNLHQVGRASTLPDGHSMPHHLSLQIFTTCMVYFLSPGMSAELINFAGFSLWCSARQPNRNAALIPPADRATSHEKSRAQRAHVFVHTPSLFLWHSSSAAQAGQSSSRQDISEL